jgi:hypothetical protein
MPGALTITPRKQYLEDFDKTTTKGATASVYVKGLGTTTLSLVDFISLSNLVSAASDGAAASAGVPVGCLYYSTSLNLPKTRMS